MIIASHNPKGFVEEILQRTFTTKVMSIMNVDGRNRKSAISELKPKKYGFGQSKYCGVLCGRLVK